MKRILTAIVFSLVALSAMAQTQRVVVKTPGRQQDDGSITKGQRIAEAYVTVQGGNTYESDTNGELRMGKPSAGKYRFSGVRKEGYELADADFLMRDHNYSAENTLYINMDSGDELRALTRKVENKVRRNYMAQLQAKTDEIERLRAEGKTTREELLRMQAEIDAAWDNFEKMVEEKAREYLTIDFDLTDDFKSEISYYIINGELQKADSMLATRGDLDERITRNIRLREQTEKEIVSLAEECYYKHDICSQRFECDSAAYWLERRTELDPENVEWINDAADYIYLRIGDYNRALEYLNKALKIREKVLGTEHPSTAINYNDIGVCYDNLGDYDKAFEYYNKALKIQEKVLGTKHPDTALSYNNIGGYHNKLGDYDKALVYLNKALEIREKVLGTEHPDTAASYNNIGGGYNDLDDYDTALEYYNKALKIFEKFFGAEHPNTQIVKENIAYCQEQLEATK